MVAFVSSFDLFFGFGGAVPVGEDEAAFFDLRFEIIPGIDAKRVAFAEFERFGVNVCLDLAEQSHDVTCDTVKRTRFFG